MRRLAMLLALLALLSGCASGPTVSAHGDSSAFVRSGEITTTTETTVYPDGRRTVIVIEECQNCVEEKADGGPGSAKLYSTMATIFGAIIAMGSFVFQALN